MVLDGFSAVFAPRIYFTAWLRDGKSFVNLRLDDRIHAHWRAFVESSVIGMSAIADDEASIGVAGWYLCVALVLAHCWGWSLGWCTGDGIERRRDCV